MKMKWMLVLGALMLATPAAAEYPDHPIEFVCATSPGSGAARWCQIMADGLSQPEALGQPVRVIFKGGGSGNEAATYAMQREADGYTLLHANGSWAGYMNLPTFSYKLSDFDFMAIIEKSLFALGVKADSPYKTFAEVIAAAKEKPGEISVGGNKIGSIPHRMLLDLNKAAGVELAFVPYEGTGDVVKDVLGGHIPVGFGQHALWIPHVKAGNARVLLTINEERLPAMPDVPVPSELGLDYKIAHQWQGFFLKAGVPDDVKAKIAAALKTVVESQAYKDYLAQNPHVVPAFETDTAKLNADFAEQLKDFRAFMQAQGLL